MESITKILTRYGSDKGDGHGYGPVYDRLFPPDRRPLVQAVLELGVFKGASMVAWREAFPNAVIVGLDIGLCSPCPRLDRIRLVQGDQRSRYALREAVQASGGEDFDLIVDDASHVLSSQLFSLFVLWRHLRSGGYYGIEELDYNLAGSPGEMPSAWRDTVSLFRGAEMVEVSGTDAREPLLVIKKQ